MADVAQPGGAEQGVDHGVGEHVGVGVPVEAELVGDLDPAEQQRPALDEAVGVEADAEAGTHPSGSSRRSRPSNTTSSLTPRSPSSSTACS
jgi:hypothetical protein